MGENSEPGGSGNKDGQCSDRSPRQDPTSVHKYQATAGPFLTSHEVTEENIKGSLAGLPQYAETVVQFGTLGIPILVSEIAGRRVSG